MPRDMVAGPDHGPEPPFPIRVSGKIVKGFGRGSKELGIPTANLPIAGLEVGGHTDMQSGVYFGWAGLSLATAMPNPDPSSAVAPPEALQNQTDLKHGTEHVIGGVVDALLGSSKDPYSATELHRTRGGKEFDIYPMVMSIGWNPYYKNEVRSVEVHLMHNFKEDFYNAMMNLSILGFIRPEKDYESKESLVEDIRTDIEVAGRSLERHAYAEWAKDHFLNDFDWEKKSNM